MTHVATLISNPAALNDALIERARSLLPASASARWLARGIAADISFTPDAKNSNRDGARLLAEDVRSLLHPHPVDVVVLRAEGRRKKLFVADMDSTMIGQECIDELADYAGVKAKVAAITERAMRGEIAFEPALRERVALLKGLPAAIIDEVIAERIRLASGARTLVATMRANGAYTCLVSGGFTAFVSRIATMIGFNEFRANDLVVDAGGHISGVAEPILGREAKLEALIELTKRLGAGTEETLAAGDGANDIPMIEAAGLGVAYHAKPKVAAAAPARIDHADLTALLYLQGYRREEFIEG